jgi:hypothetical protein
VTTLELSEAAIAPVSDLSDVLLFCHEVEDYDEGKRSQVRTYAGGRRRVVSSPGGMETVNVAIDWIDRDDYYRLLDLAGAPVLFRGPRGRRVYGVFPSLSGGELSYSDVNVGPVSFSIEEIDVSEVV